MEEQEDSEIDALNNETFGDVQDNWEIDDHVIPYDFGEQDAFPPLRNGAPPPTVYEDINELSERVASSILDDEDEGVKKRVPWLESKDRNIEPKQPGAIYEGAPRKPLKVLTVQELEQQMRNDHCIPGRSEATNNQMPSLEQCYRQGAIPKNPPPGILYINPNPANHVNTNQIPPQRLQNQGYFVRGPSGVRPHFDRFPNPHRGQRHQRAHGPRNQGQRPEYQGPHHAHQGPYQGQHRFPPPPGPYPGQYSQGPPSAHFERPAFMPPGGMGPQQSFMRPRNPGPAQYPRQQGPRHPYPGNMGRGRGGSNHQYQFAPPPVYVQYPNPAVTLPANSHHMDDRRVRPQYYEGEYDNSSSTDEYANLMSHQEKNFLKNIQLNALSIQNPYMDDFYYTMKNKRANQEDGGSNQSQDRYNREHHNMNRNIQSTKASYIPQQFEKSLGKLQIGSVSAPRKIIDTEVVEHDGRYPPDDYSKSMQKKDKLNLMEIEEGYSMIMKIQYGNELGLPEHEIRESEKYVMDHFQSPKIDPYVLVNKGRILLLRTIDVIKSNAYTERCLKWLPVTYRVEQENTHLVKNLPNYLQYFETALLEQIMDLAKTYEGVVIWDKNVMVAVVTMMVKRVAEIYNDQDLSASVTGAQRTNWIEFLKHQANNIPQDRSTSPQPVPLLERELLVRHLSSLFTETDEGTKTKLITAFGKSCFQTNQNP